MDIQPAYIVEDLEDQRVLIGLYLNKFLPEVPVVIFESAQALFIKMKEPHLPHNRPFVIVLDLNMPDMNGYQALRLLKQISEPDFIWWQSVPVAMTSVLVTKEEVEESRRLGSIAFLNKSPDLQALMNLLKDMQ